MDNEEIISLLQHEEEDLFFQIGECVHGESAFPPSRKILIEKGGKWFSDQQNKWSPAICNNSKIKTFAKESLSVHEAVILTAEIMNVITELAAGVRPVVISVLIVRQGLHRLCKKYWDSEK